MLGVVVSNCAVACLLSSCGFARGSALIVFESVSLVGDGSGSDAGPLVDGSAGR